MRKLLFAALAASLGVACSVEVERDDDVSARAWGDGTVCGGVLGLACPTGATCVDDPNDNCDPKHFGNDCSGICVGPPSCGGLAGLDCPRRRQVCVDDPSDACDPGAGDADCSGICVMPVFCGGFTGVACASGYTCEDDPRDSCDPDNGGADCNGVCVPDPSSCGGDLCES